MRNQPKEEMKSVVRRTEERDEQSGDTDRGKRMSENIDRLKGELDGKEG